MSQHPVKVLDDGTRVYSNYTRYTPVPDSERKYAKRKPNDPRAFRHNGDWLLPLPLTPDTKRPKMPVTRPDTDAYEHAELYGARHNCDVCRRPEALRWIRKWYRDNGLGSR